MSHQANDAFDGSRLHVMSKRCAECLLSKGKIVSDKRKELILDDCKRSGKYFLCHKGTMNGEAIVCRGFFDTVPNQAVQIASRLGLVAFVEPKEKP